MQICGVLLDFYGTVVDEDDDVIRGICEEIADSSTHAAEEVGDMWEREFVRAMHGSSGSLFESQRGISVSTLSRVLHSIHSDRDAEELCKPQFRHWRSAALREGSQEFLAACELPVCVVSNIDREDIEAAIDHHNLVLPYLVTSDDVGAYKPHRAIFDAGLDVLGLTPGEVLHIGDSLSADVAGANALGIEVAWVNPRGRSAPASARIDHDVIDLREILPALTPFRAADLGHGRG